MSCALNFGVSEAGIPAIAEMSLMPVTPQWLPVEDSFERQLVERLVAQGRSFIKGLRYNLRRDQCLATATLTDTGSAGQLLFLVLPGQERTAELEGMVGPCPPPTWTWQPAVEAMPQLPLPVQREQARCPAAGSPGRS